MAEGWISDDYALDKNKTKVYPGVRRQRIKTVDRVDELFAGLTGSFMVLQLAQTPVQAGMTGAPSVMFPASQTAPVQSGQVPAAPAATVPAPAPVEGAVATAPAVVPPAVPEKKGHWVAETPLPLPETQTEPAGLADTQTGEGTALPGYKRIAPQQIPGNIIKMLNDNWMLVTAGNDAKFNMMTASWGGLGVLFASRWLSALFRRCVIPGSYSIKGIPIRCRSIPKPTGMHCRFAGRLRAAIPTR